MAIESFKNQEELLKIKLNKIDQITTRGDGHLEKGEFFDREDIDFSAASHLNIHTSGDVSGSQFNGKVFKKPEDLINKIKSILPENLQYDQFSRCELTLDIESENGEPVGWSGVKSINELLNNNIDIVKQARIPGGISANESGIDGSWYPEMEKDSSGNFIIAKNEDGSIRNEKAKFEPLANIALVPKSNFYDNLKTEKITLIIQKNKLTNKPDLITVFPGENAPAFPAKIDTLNYKNDNLNPNSNEMKFWNEHVFLKLMNSSNDEMSKDKEKVIQERKEEDDKKIEKIKSELSIGSSVENNNLEDLNSDIDLFVNKVEQYVGEHTEYMMGYSFENVVSDALDDLSKKYGKEIDFTDLVESDNESNSEDNENSDEGITKGKVLVSGKEVLSYSSNSDGYNASIDKWNKNNLKEVLLNILK